MELLITFLIMLVFLVLKGFFSGSEIAIVNSDKFKMRHLAKTGDRKAALLLKMFRTPDVILGTTLVGTNIATVTISTLGAILAIEAFGEIGDLIAILVMTPFLLIFGEIVPKSVFQQKADIVARAIIPILRVFTMVFYPVIFVFSRIARFATRLVGGSSTGHTLFITREELSVLLDINDAGTGATPGKVDRRSIRRVIRFADTTVGQAMIPLADVVGFNEVRTTADAVQTVLKFGYNRLPVYRGNITNVKGVLTLTTWDMLDPTTEERRLSEFIRPPLYLSPQQTIDQTLKLLQAREDHLGIVVDEFGSAIGIITMEDIFEEVVGDIEVGYDFDEYQSKRQFTIEEENENSYLMSGRAPLSEVNDKLHIKLPVYAAHTIGGYVVSRLRRIPQEGEAVVDEGFRFTVLEADPRTVLKVRMERL
ncbi:MAG: HlyC/CorC family transporter [Gammaproteobacteria bacterium]|jgi:CBS domain containing-hemolysin-like protein|nr:hemolysin family protein [Candidatus Thioaporhodococcus sediminis]TNF53872.1 MAG: HlyC/CorC family transporter [Gammaproteobacteria bacterium]